MLDWQPIETAPRDGTLFLSRNADHLSFGVSVTYRHVEWVLNDQTGQPECFDLGSWIDVHDFDRGQWGTGKAPRAALAVAADEYNSTVRREWLPLDALMEQHHGDA